MNFKPHLIPVTTSNPKVTAADSFILSTVKGCFVNHGSVFSVSFSSYARMKSGLPPVNQSLNQGFMAALTAVPNFKPAPVLNASETPALETGAAPVYIPAPDPAPDLAFVHASELHTLTGLSAGHPESIPCASNLIVCSSISNIATEPVSLAPSDCKQSGVTAISLSAGSSACFSAADSSLAVSLVLSPLLTDLVKAKSA